MDTKFLQSIRAVPEHFTPALLAHTLVYAISFGAGWAASTLGNHSPSPWPALPAFILRCREAGLSPDRTFFEAQHWLHEHHLQLDGDLDVLRRLCDVPANGERPK